MVVTDAIVGANILDYASIPNAVYTGMTLVGWAYDDAGATMVVAGENITDGLTVYAIWEETVYTVTYALDGGTNDAANPATFVISDLPITLGDATKALNTFGGWYTEVALTNAVTEITAVGNKSLFAKFTLT